MNLTALGGSLDSLDGAGDYRPRQVWIHQTVSEEVTIKERGHICTWDDYPRGTYKLTASGPPIMESHFHFAGGDRQSTL